MNGQIILSSYHTWRWSSGMGFLKIIAFCPRLKIFHSFPICQNYVRISFNRSQYLVFLRIPFCASNSHWYSRIFLRNQLPLKGQPEYDFEPLSLVIHAILYYLLLEETFQSILLRMNFIFLFYLWNLTG